MHPSKVSLFQWSQCVIPVVDNTFQGIGICCTKPFHWQGSRGSVWADVPTAFPFCRTNIPSPAWNCGWQPPRPASPRAGDVSQCTLCRDPWDLTDIAARMMLGAGWVHHTKYRFMFHVVEEVDLLSGLSCHAGKWLSRCPSSSPSSIPLAVTHPGCSPAPLELSTSPLSKAGTEGNHGAGGSTSSKLRKPPAPCPVMEVSDFLL